MSLFDAFNDSEAAGTLSGGDGFITTSPVDGTSYQPVMLEAGYVSAGFSQEETPIFSLDPVQFQFPARLAALAVSNEILIMALHNFHILRINLQQAHEVEDIEIPHKSSDGLIHKIFFDPTGRHLIMTTDKGENYYLYQKWTRTKQLGKLKGLVIESVAWNKTALNTSTSTKEILLGTRNGLIYETCLEASEDYLRNQERYLRQVYSVNDPSMSIFGLHFEQWPTNAKKYFVIAATATRIYQFVGNVNMSSADDRAVFDSLFNRYEQNPGFQEFPGDLSYSELSFWGQHRELQGIVQSFAWLIGPGIYTGNLVFGSQNPGDSVISNPNLLPYPATVSENDPEEVISETPISLALTEFHLILLYKDRIRAINTLNDDVVYDEPINIPPGQEVKRIVVDTIKNTFWIYTDLTLHELTITHEDRDVWKIYLSKKQYDTALQYTKDPAQRDKVLTMQANDYFEQGRWSMSAKYYAESAVPFEEVVLKFVEKDERDALKVYLLTRLERLRKSDITQRTIIATWLVEIFLSKLNQSEENILSATSEADLSNFNEQKEEIEDEFRHFLDNYQSCLHKPTTFKLISSHGRTDELLYYATLIGDYDRVIAHWISTQEWDRALEVLGKQTNLDLFYKFSPVLMANKPYETVNSWLRQTNLNPRQLIPSLLKYDASKLPEGVTANQAIRYLSQVVTSFNNTDPAIHNFLLTLYATQSSKDESALLTFLKNEGREMHYNLDYALRLCSQNDRVQSCVYIYSQMGLYEEAVNLALKHGDLELACINADKPDDDEPLRKKLWLNIAKNVIAEKKDIKTAMAFLKRSELLQIADILPFFPDFVVIDDFKDEICAALEDYNVHIDELKADMDEATKSAENIRLDIRELRNRFAVIGAMEKCDICNTSLLTRQFYVFPCQHSFHADCLINRVTQHLNTRQIRRLVDLQEQVSKEIKTTAASTQSRLASAAGTVKDVIFPSTHTVNGDDSAVFVARSEQLKEELDDIVAAECVLCGDAMIKSVDQPFIGDEPDRIVDALVSSGVCASVSKSKRIGGSTAGDTYKADIEGSKEGVKHIFLKVSPSASAYEAFHGEYKSLKGMFDAVPGICPKPLAINPAGTSPSFFATAYVNLGGSASAGDIKFARQLAQLHQKGLSPTHQYGFPCPTFCGETEQDNTWNDDWETFFRERRIRCMVDACLQRWGHDDKVAMYSKRICGTVIPKVIGTVKDAIQPVLIHGDLWGGNWSVDASTDDVVIYDPSSYYAHNEMELGMIRWMGGVGAAFYEEYHAHIPKLEPYYTERQKLYELYHHLNHWLIFGSGYKSGAVRIMKTAFMCYSVDCAEARYNPLTGTWVLCAESFSHGLLYPSKNADSAPDEEHKAETKAKVAYDSGCYLCPRNTRSSGIVNPDYTSVHVFLNDYGCVNMKNGHSRKAYDTADLLKAQFVSGYCYVLCFSPRHDLNMADLPGSAILKIVQAWKEYYLRMLEEPHVQYLQIFENKGALMGCSSPHPHQQLWATDYIPHEVTLELDAQLEYYKKHGSNLLLDYVKLELSSENSRLVDENDTFVVIVPPWATWPFETIIIAKERCSVIVDMTEKQLTDLAMILRRTTMRYDILFDQPTPYSMGVHQRQCCGREDVPAECQQLHIHFYPPLGWNGLGKKYLTGFDLVGMPTRSLMPEDAARSLRQIKLPNYSTASMAAKTLSFQDFADKNTRNELYVAIHDKVYNVTKFLEEHPGGEEVLLDEGGKDATAAFEDVGHSEEARTLLKDFYVADLRVDPAAAAAAKSKQAASKVATKAKGEANSSGSALRAFLPIVFLVGYLYYRFYYVKQ
ncbi:hypothetical protein BZG36_00188 [Bifiguratus adelaidae]|uniref:Galactose-1-phosphate uridylyltransferase n=1 Tax=Bifiguratus adelaidae TaxID=1938954 RepID=A0A261Y872_9FUNG|nr:hypothetical protein BZG36_00188 [Bifiguratus adelaidae]